MKKYFVVSDIHGFYDELISALREAGFDSTNKDHVFVCCGDYFDRGPKPYEVMQFIMSLPNKILIKGNHEELMVDMLCRGFVQSHDIHNGTQRTVLQLMQYVNQDDAWFDDEHKFKKGDWDKVYDLIKPFYDSMIDYYETDNFIFVHGWIPQDDDWRSGDWSSARWNNGMYFNRMFGNPTDKTVVCGHYHSSYGWANYVDDDEYEEFPPKDDKEYLNKCFQPFYDEQLIAIDGCTAYSGLVNVVVLEDY